MSELEIIETALENLKKDAGIAGKWVPKTRGSYDGKLTLNFGNEKITFLTEIKKELRINQMSDVLDRVNGVNPALVVAGRLLPKVKEELRQNKISYLEANGNFYHRSADKWFLLDTHSSIKFKQNVKNRAFTKTGLRVLFEILNNPELLQKPYRTIAGQTKTSVGNVVNILNGLKKEDFLLHLRKNEFILHNREKLIKKWAEAFEQNLKPVLKIGTFRFLTNENHWTEIDLKENKTFWGGEPGGDILTNYLVPAEFTLYTEESRNELIKNYRLVPDEKGNVQVFKKFWIDSFSKSKAVPPLIAYSDLVNMHDKRCQETAAKIYDTYLRENI
jgi:hypothetical protein